MIAENQRSNFMHSYGNVTATWSLPQHVYDAYQANQVQPVIFSQSGEELEKTFKLHGGFLTGKNAYRVASGPVVFLEQDYSDKGVQLETREYDYNPYRQTRLKKKTCYAPSRPHTGRARFDTVHEVLNDHKICLGFDSHVKGYAGGMLISASGRPENLPARLYFSETENGITVSKSSYECNLDSPINADIADFRERMQRVLAHPDAVAAEDQNVADIVLPVAETFKLIKEHTPGPVAVFFIKKSNFTSL